MVVNRTPFASCRPKQDPAVLRRTIGYAFKGIGPFPHYRVTQNVEIVQARLFSVTLLGCPSARGWLPSMVSVCLQRTDLRHPFVIHSSSIRHPFVIHSSSIRHPFAVWSGDLGGFSVFLAIQCDGDPM
jgi:hypothetical protein